MFIKRKTSAGIRLVWRLLMKQYSRIRQLQEDRDQLIHTGGIFCWATLLIFSHSGRQPPKTWLDTRWDTYNVALGFHGETMLQAKVWRPADVVPPIAAFDLQDMSLRGCLTPTHKTDTLLCQDSKCEMLPHEEWQDARQVRHLTASFSRPISWAAAGTIISADIAASSATRTADVSQNALRSLDHAYSYRAQPTFWLYVQQFDRLFLYFLKGM